MVVAGRLKQLASVTVIFGVTFGSLAAPASPSTAGLIDVVISPECKYLPPGVPCLPGSAQVLVYRAGRGEANRVRLASSPRGVLIRDPAAVIEAGQGCSPIDRHGVSCSAPDPGVSRVFIATGSGADTVRSELPGYLIVDGGPGNDLVTGGPGGDTLYGGMGADVLRGGDGADGLYDGSPRQPLRSGDADPFDEQTVVALASAGRSRDSFLGGRGHDRVSYAGRHGSVTVDLATAARIGGARGERDSVTGVESAVGGAGDDRLAGNDRRVNELDGGEGDDRIVGRRGADYIEAGTGRNVITAGPGDDIMSATYRSSDYGPERIFCGPGADRVSWIFPSDFLNDDCENLEFNFLGRGGLFGGGAQSLLPLRKGSRPTVLSATELWCFAGLNPSGCQLRLELRVHGPAARRGTSPPRGTLLGSESYTFAADERKGVTVGVSATGLSVLRRHRALRVLVSATEDPVHLPSGYLTVLRAP